MAFKDLTYQQQKSDPSVAQEMSYWESRGQPITVDAAIGNVATRQTQISKNLTPAAVPPVNGVTAQPPGSTAVYVPPAQEAPVKSGVDTFQSAMGRSPESQEEWDAIGDWEALKNKQYTTPYDAQVDQAFEQSQDYSQPNVFMSFLKTGLKAKLKPEQQKLGQSGLFDKAGLTGMASLGASLQARIGQLKMSGDVLAAALNSARGVYTDIYDRLNRDYERLYDKQQSMVERQQELDDEYLAFQRQMYLIDKNQKLDLEKIKFQDELDKEMLRYNEELGRDTYEIQAEIDARYETGTYQLVTGENGFGSYNTSDGTLKTVEEMAKSGMRTDRHNNPTAFTTDLAKQAGLVLGTDYTKGDPFPNNPNLFTARLIGDGVNQTIKMIDAVGFYTQAGGQRWTHTAMSNEEWNGKSRDEKIMVINSMYQKENGDSTASILRPKGYTGDTDTGTYGAQNVDNWAKNIIAGRASLGTIGDDKLQNLVNTRIGELEGQGTDEVGENIKEVATQMIRYRNSGALDDETWESNIKLLVNKFGMSESLASSLVAQEMERMDNGNETGSSTTNDVAADVISEWTGQSNVFIDSPSQSSTPTLIPSGSILSGIGSTFKTAYSESAAALKDIQRRGL